MTLVFAHRGAAVEEPENTLPAFLRALELGADALETDAWLTRDGVVVLSHDGDGRRMAGVGRAIRDVTFAELREWDAGYGFLDARGRPFAGRGYRLPSLEELLAEVPGVRVNVDLKSTEPALVDAFIATVRGLGAEERVIAASFSRETLRRVREQDYRGQTSLARLEFLCAWLVPAFLAGARAPGDRAQIPTHTGPFSLATPGLVAQLRGRGLAIDYWTINDPSEAAALVELGADGVMTDDPARIVPAVRAAELTRTNRP